MKYNYYGAGYTLISTQGYHNNHDILIFNRGEHYFANKLDIAKLIISVGNCVNLAQMNYNNYIKIINLLKPSVEGKWEQFTLNEELKITS